MPARVSVLVPTRDEADNVAPLLERIGRCLDPGECEVVFVDDSDDDTPERVRQAAAAPRSRARWRGPRAGSFPSA